MTSFDTILYVNTLEASTNKTATLGKPLIKALPAFLGEQNKIQICFLQDSAPSSRFRGNSRKPTGTLRGLTAVAGPVQVLRLCTELMGGWDISSPTCPHAFPGVHTEQLWVGSGPEKQEGTWEPAGVCSSWLTT